MLRDFDVGDFVSSDGDRTVAEGTHGHLDVSVVGLRTSVLGEGEVVRAEHVFTVRTFHRKEVQTVALFEGTVLSKIWELHCQF